MSQLNELRILRLLEFNGYILITWRKTWILELNICLHWHSHGEALTLRVWCLDMGSQREWLRLNEIIGWGPDLVQFSPSVVSKSLQPHESPHTRPPVHHQLSEFTQTHIHRVSDDIQPSHLLSSPSPPAPNPSQHQSLSQRVHSSHEVAKVLEFQL